MDGVCRAGSKRVYVYIRAEIVGASNEVERPRRRCAFDSNKMEDAEGGGRRNILAVESQSRLVLRLTVAGAEGTR